MLEKEEQKKKKERRLLRINHPFTFDFKMFKVHTYVGGFVYQLRLASLVAFVPFVPKSALQSEC